MQPSTRYGVAVLIGALAGGIAYFGADPVVDETVTLFATGLNAIVWSAGTALYLNVFDRLNQAPNGSCDDSKLAAAKWGAAGGGVASLGISGTSLLLISTTQFRYVAVVGLFVFGLVLASMAVGMGTVAGRFIDSQGRPKTRNSTDESANTAGTTVD